MENSYWNASTLGTLVECIYHSQSYMELDGPLLVSVCLVREVYYCCHRVTWSM